MFAYKGELVQRMLNSSWCRVREKVGLKQVRVHDLKHTFGRKLRAAGVSFEDRQDLLGHRSGRMTTHYSAAELSKLIESANRVCERNGNRPELVVLRRLNRCPGIAFGSVTENARSAYAVQMSFNHRNRSLLTQCLLARHSCPAFSRDTRTQRRFFFLRGSTTR